MGHENITAFDKTVCEDVTRYVASISDTVNKTPSALGPSADLKLDATLQNLLKPGSQNWDVAKNLLTQAGVFGGSAHARYAAVEQESRAFAHALTDVIDVFEHTDDLATYDATKFANEHPDVGGAG
jgi:hypothetical protein